MKRKALSFCTILCTALFFVSCSKENEETKANLMIVNASPNGGSIDASVNNSVMASGIVYPNNSGYKTVASGTSNIRITATGSSNEILNGSVNMEAGSHYSFYVVDSAHKRQATFLRDDLSAPAAGKAKVRILHLSPNSPAVDINITGSGSSAINLTNRTFNDVKTNANAAAFTEVDAAGLNVQVRAAGTTNTLATVPVPALTAGKIYTIIIKGFAGSANATQTLGIEVIQHN